MIPTDGRPLASTGAASPLRLVLTGPFLSGTWLATAHASLGLGVTFVIFLAATIMVVLTLSLSFTAVLLPPMLWLMLLGAQGVGIVERARVDALLGVRLDDPYVPFTGTIWRRAWQRLISGTAWKEMLYALLAFPVSVVGFVLVVGAWAIGFTLLLLPFTISAMPDDVAHLGFVDIHRGVGVLTASAAGLVMLFVAPWVAQGWGRSQVALGRRLLSRDITAELEERVDELETTRAWAVDVAEAERRRIERDLHDGAQQRLVALAMNLGMAKEKFDSDPDAARQLVDASHREAKAAITELRDLARGIHPVSLSDRGLPGAIPALVGRCPLPVEVHVDVPDRPSASIEGMTYFLVSECLTNAVKHARATRLVVRVEQQDDPVTGCVLLVEVTDDGVGGADLTLGGGLRGLADRASSVDGTFQVSSPIGGPTTIRGVLPCAS